MSRNFIASVLSAFVGGVFGAYLLVSLGHSTLLPQAAAATPTPTPDVVSARRIRLLDAAGRTRAELAISPDGGAGLFFFDTQGRNRMVLGLYSPGEGEQPAVVLNDTRQRAAGIFRLVGAQETPVVVFKNSGVDRSIFGLNPSSIEPFLVNYSTERKKTAVFGNF